MKLWTFPIAIGVTYWLFDTFTDYVNPPVPTDLLCAFWPSCFSAGFIFRLVMSICCVIGARLFEGTMIKVRQLEKQLYLSEYAVENTKAFAMLWTNETGQFIKVNKFAADKLGYTKQELLSRTLFDLCPDHTLAKWKKLLAQLKISGSTQYVTQHRRKDGTHTDAVVYLQYLHAHGNQYQFAFVCDVARCPADGSPTPVLPSIDDVLAAGPG